MAEYGMKTVLKGTMDEIKFKLADALKAQGFGILNEIDMQKTLKEKIGQNIEPYLILGICNHNLAIQVLSEDREMGLLLPCKALLRETGSNVEVSLLDPEAMFSIIGSDWTSNDSLKSLAGEAKLLLKGALVALAS